MNEFELLDKVEATSGKLDKAALLKGASTQKNVHELLDAVFNYKRKFRMKTFVSYPQATTFVDHHTTFIQLLTKLEKQTGRTNECVVEVENLLRLCTPQQAKWYNRILHQDLKAGFSIDTAIKCGYSIPKFEVQLAKDGNDCKSLDKLLKLGCKASRKYDGYRCIAVVDSGDVTLYSRNGEPYQNFPQIQEAIAALLPEDAQLVFDGEIMSDDFNSMQQTAFSSKSKKSVGDVAYHIFDQIDFTEWQTDSFKQLHQERLSKLANTFIEYFKDKTTALRLVEHTTVTTLDQIQELERTYIEDGFEGVMVNPNVPYYRGRKSNRMMKFKTMKSWDCPIIEYYQGKPDTKNANRLGGVIVMQENGITCEVGSGWSDEEREHMWNNKDLYIGRYIEAVYQELTPDGKMRFPTKRRFRSDHDSRE